MASNEIGIQRVNDSNLLKIFVEQTLVETEKFGFSSAAVVTVNIQGSSFFIRNTEGEDDENNFYLKDGKIENEFIKSILNDISSNNKVSRITLGDRTIHQHFTISYARSSEGLIDKLISPSHQTNTKALVIITHICDLLGESPLNNYQITEEFNIASVHHDVLTRLEGLSIELIKKQTEQAKEYEEEKKKFIDQQLEDYKNRVAELENGTKEKLEQLEAEFKEKNEQLVQREKLVEDADNTTARRKTTTSMLAEVQEKAKKFNFSDTVTNRSWLACYFAITLAIIAGYTTFSSTEEVYQNFELLNQIAQSESIQLSNGENPATNSRWSIAVERSKELLWFFFVKIFFGSVLMVSSIIYLIRWFNSWADRLAQQELDNQIFVRDLNRAHLAIEMSLEWNEKKDGPIPERLLESLTDNLFVTTDNTPQELLHPSEQLASALVRSADKINLPFVGGTVEISGKKLGKEK